MSSIDFYSKYMYNKFKVYFYYFYIFGREATTLIDGRLDIFKTLELKMSKYAFLPTSHKGIRSYAVL